MTKTRTITQTAILIALAVCFQLLLLIGGFNALPISQYIVGSLVNLVLFIAASRVGLWGLLVGIITPIIAFFTGHLAFPVLMPVIMIGNCLIPFVWWLLHAKLKLVSEFITAIIASCVKAAFLWFVAPAVFSAWVVPTLSAALGAKKYAIFATSMSYPQLVAALIGGVLAVIILRLLPKQTQA